MAYADTKIDAFAPSEFRVGQVFSKSLSVFFQNFVIFSSIAATVALPVIIASVIEQGGTAEHKAINGAIGFALLIFLSPLSTAVILHAAFQHMSGRPVRVSESVSRAFARFLPLLGLMILQTLGIMLGFALLFIPGFIVFMMWYVAVPACVVERTGPVRSLARSRQLTKGFRSKLFAIVLLTSVLGPIVSGLLIVAGSLLAGQCGDRSRGRFLAEACPADLAPC